MSEMDRELNWDDEIVKDNSVVTLPEGYYELLIYHVQLWPSKNHTLLLDAYTNYSTSQLQ